MNSTHLGVECFPAISLRRCYIIVCNVEPATLTMRHRVIYRSQLDLQAATQLRVGLQEPSPARASMSVATAHVLQKEAQQGFQYSSRTVSKVLHDNVTTTVTESQLSRSRSVLWEEAGKLRSALLGPVVMCPCTAKAKGSCWSTLLGCRRLTGSSFSWNLDP